jgi:hypothetical protein
MITKPASEVTDADRPFVCSRGHADGTVTLYYEGDVIPPLDVPVTSNIPPVSAWQIRKALNQLNLRDMVEAAVAGSGDQTIIDGWEYAGEFSRNDPLVVSMGMALNLTDADLDGLFNLANTL